MYQLLMLSLIIITRIQVIGYRKSEIFYWLNIPIHRGIERGTN